MSQLVPLSTPVPSPEDWARLHALMLHLWREREDPEIPKPPVPLILAGAAFSSARDIRRRWGDFICWANENALAELFLGALPPAPTEDFAERLAGVSEEGRGWWPSFGEQYHEPKKRPSKESAAAALRRLIEGWPQVAGHEIAPYTRPVCFRGSKLRRLVVFADVDSLPPWGSWSYIRFNPLSFTNFRKSVNVAIAPLEVDVIDFREIKK
jgi:hypothetical protein